MKNKKDKQIKSTRVSSIGGQALMEGVMMRSRGSMAMAVREPNGRILLETKRFSNKGKGFNKIPILRGLIAFFVSIASSVQTLTRSSEVAFIEDAEDEEMPKGWLIFAVVLGLMLGIGLFIVLPSILTSLLFDTILKAGDMIFLSSLFEAFVRIFIFVMYLFLISKMKGIKRTFMYHGAEHKTINCYEKRLDMTVENIKTCSTRHNRCGTTFLFFVMIVAIAIFSVTNYFLYSWGINAQNYGKIGFMLIKVLVRLAFLPLVAGLSYELLRGLALLPDNKFTFVLRAPGLALQRLTTYEPDDEMMEIALKSFNAVLEMDEDKSIPCVLFGEYTINEIRRIILEELKDTNADKSEADWILCDVLKVKRNALKDIEKINLKQFGAISRILSRRKKGEPLWYILGYTDFYGERLIVNNNVLIPRPETELLCEKAIEHIKSIDKSEGERVKVLDLCTGSGCIALAILKNTDALVIASDVSEGAVEIAKKNLKDKAEVKLSDMFTAFEKDGESGKTENEKFDVIICNPPYIKSETLATLDKEVKDFEPLTALDGGEDGLKYYKIIASRVADFLNESGVVLLEIGFDEAEQVKALLCEQFKSIEIFKDYNDLDRIIFARKGTL